MTITVDAPRITLAGAIRDLDREHPDYTDQDITSALANVLERHPEPLAVARPALVAYVNQVRRNKVREHEKQVVAVWEANGPDPLKGRKEAVASFRYWAELLVVDVVNVGGVERRAGELTAEEWERRAGELDAQIGPLSESRDRARWIANGLRATKKHNLDAVLA